MKKETPQRKFYQQDFIAKEDDSLLIYLQKQFSEKSRNEIKSFLRHRQIMVNDQCRTAFDYSVKRGDKVSFLSIGLEKPNPNHKCRIVYEDDDLIVVEKKYGVLSMSRGKEGEETVFSIMMQHVRRRDKNARVFIVHRLDRETSGLMMLAKSEKAQSILQDKWNDNILERKYVAIVEGAVEKEEDKIVSYLTESQKSLKMHSSPTDNGGKKAITNYKVLQRGQYYSLLELSLETGRKNQIRVQLASIGHCVAGDKKYGATSNPLKRICLHAQSLSFKHPTTKKRMEFSTDIPKEFL